MRPYLTLHDPRTARDYYEKGLWRGDTFYTLLARNATATPEAIALRDGRKSISWKALLDWVDGVATAFRADGLTIGDRVSVWLSNRVETVVVFLACSREGFACNPSLHRNYTCAEIIQLLQRLQSSILVTEPGWGADRETVELAPLLDGLPDLRRHHTLAAIETMAHAAQTPGTSEAEMAGTEAVVETPMEGAHNPDRVGYLAFTSGTTGVPKCVMHSANTLLANARDMVTDWGLDTETRILSLSPLSHHIAWVAVSQWLIAGCRLITDDPPEGVTRLDWIMDSGATYVLGVPTHAMDVLQAQRGRGVEKMGNVRQFYMAGSPIPPTVAEALFRQGIKPQNVYGMTENSSHQYTCPTDDPAVIIGTCGRGGPAYEVRIFDADNPDKPLPVGETGQIGGRGAALMLGYFDNQDATESSFNASGWFLSGDLGSLDEQGNLHIQGRLKDLIIRGGHNIYPSHIEALTLRHPRVEKTAAFAVPDERLGEKVCVAVIGELDGRTLLDHLHAEGLSKYDMPEYFLRVEQFPLTPSGKILKRELPEMLKRGEIAPQPIRFIQNQEQA